MAKKRRMVVGSVLKNSKTGNFYIKVNGDHQLHDKQFLNLDNRKTQLQSLENAVSEGKLSEDIAEKARERINKVPWADKENKEGFVQFEISVMVEQSES